MSSSVAMACLLSNNEARMSKTPIQDTVPLEMIEVNSKLTYSFEIFTKFSRRYFAF